MSLKITFYDSMADPAAPEPRKPPPRPTRPPPTKGPPGTFAIYIDHVEDATRQKTTRDKVGDRNR